MYLPKIVQNTRVKTLVSILAILVGISLRLFLAYRYYGNFDQESYEIVVKILKAGGNIYAETTRYNYSPIWSLILISLNSVATYINLPLHVIIRGFLTLVDVINIVLIGLIASKFKPNSGYLASAMYAINPVAILIVGYHGQFDNFATLPLLLAVYLVVVNKKTPPYLIWILGTASLLIKHITLFGVWMLFILVSKNYKRAALMMSLTLSFFLLSFIPYIAGGWQGILNNVFLYRGLQGFYGLNIFLPKKFLFILFMLVMISLPLLLKLKKTIPLSRGMEYSFVAFTVLTPGFGEQYFLLPVIWGSIISSSWGLVFSAFVSFYLLTSPNNLFLYPLNNFMILFVLNMIWANGIIWFIGLSKQLFGSRSPESKVQIDHRLSLT